MNFPYDIIIYNILLDIIRRQYRRESLGIDSIVIHIDRIDCEFPRISCQDGTMMLSTYKAQLLISN
jgi:hypothetical protein